MDNPQGITQRRLIHQYNYENRPRFNDELFNRSDDDIVRALKYVIYSCERESSFTIKVLNFEVIENYDDVNHVLFEYEDSIINKGKKRAEESTSIRRGPTKRTASSATKKKENQFAYINLKDSYLKLIKVTYYIQICEKKDGLVDDTVVVYIAIPRIVDGFYFKLNGNIYSAMYQIVDASTYNNSAAKSARKQSITFKTIFMPIRVYRYQIGMRDINGETIQCTYFVANMFKKSILLMKYIIAKFGLYGAMNFLKVESVRLVDSLDKIVDQDQCYIFPVRDMFIVVNKMLFNNIQIVQSFVYTLYSIVNYMRDASCTDMFDTKTWLKALGADFTSKDTNNYINKGISILGSLEFIYDKLSREDLKLEWYDKQDVYCVLRWMMYEFNALRQKDNLDITTKKVRWAEYIASLYAAKLATGIYRISDKGDKADLGTIRKAIQIAPMTLINAITKCQLVNYKNCVNDLDAITALKYTYKGISGIGEKSNAISSAYRSIHPSHLGRVDIDSSSNSDPGISGTICPLVELHNGHFDEYKEPSSWMEDVPKVIDQYRAMQSRVEMVKIVSEVTGKQNSNTIHQDCLSVAKKLIGVTARATAFDEYINGFDLFGDGYMFYTEEE